MLASSAVVFKGVVLPSFPQEEYDSPKGDCVGGYFNAESIVGIYPENGLPTGMSGRPVARLK